MTMNKMIIKLDNANKDIRRHEDEIRRLGHVTKFEIYIATNKIIIT